MRRHIMCLNNLCINNLCMNNLIAKMHGMICAHGFRMGHKQMLQGVILCGCVAPFKRLFHLPNSVCKPFTTEASWPFIYIISLSVFSFDKV